MIRLFVAPARNGILRQRTRSLLGRHDAMTSTAFTTSRSTCSIARSFVELPDDRRWMAGVLGNASALKHARAGIANTLAVIG